MFFFTQYNYLTLLMFAMQRIHSQGGNERIETLALESVWLTLLLNNAINEIEQAKWDFSFVIIFITLCHHITFPLPLYP